MLEASGIEPSLLSDDHELYKSFRNPPDRVKKSTVSYQRFAAGLAVQNLKKSEKLMSKPLLRERALEQVLDGLAPDSEPFVAVSDIARKTFCFIVFNF